MESAFANQWRLARLAEKQGRLPEAKAIYESLLDAEPQRLHVRLRASLVEERLGNYRASRGHAMQAADTVRLQRWADLPYVTLRLLRFDERERIAALILEADWTDSCVVTNAAVLSQHLCLAGCIEQALELLLLAETRTAPNHLLAYSKANALRYLGRMAEAAESYRKCIALKPAFPDAHWSLATHGSASPAGSRISGIEEVLAGSSHGPEERAYLHYALFREWEDAGDIVRAWMHLQKGAALKRLSLGRDPTDEAEVFAAMGEIAPAARPNDGQVSDSRTPIFIVGLPRTGTTLVERIIGGHAGVAVGGELNSFHRALCLATNRFLGVFPSLDDVDALRGVDLDRVGRDYLRHTSWLAGGKHYLTDKNPANFVYARLISAALPQARIVCLRRDPMDACMSNFKELFAGDAYGYSYDLEELADHYLHFDRLCRHWQVTMPGSFMEVRYEDLVTDPVRTASRVVEFCGIAFEAGCLDITRNKKPVATASSSQVRQPINAKGIGAWRPYAQFLEPLRRKLDPEHFACR